MCSDVDRDARPRAQLRVAFSCGRCFANIHGAGGWARRELRGSGRPGLFVLDRRGNGSRVPFNG